MTSNWMRSIEQNFIPPVSHRLASVKPVWPVAAVFRPQPS